MTRTNHRPRRLRIPASVGITLLAIVISGCFETSAEPILFENRSDQRILIYLEPNDDDAWKTLNPGRAVTDESVCVDPDMVARVDDGSVVGTREGPFCEGDAPWVFTQDDVDQAQAP